MRRSVFILILAALCMPCLSQPFKKATPLSPERIESQFLELLSAGKQSDAEELLNTNVKNHLNNQRIVFLLACCVRSRFMVRDAVPIFVAAMNMGTNSPSGQCALHILYLDSKKESDQHFSALRELVENNPGDPILRWMMAVQCRTYDKNEEGCKHYAKLLEKWNPGPVLVHQTYANLLDELKKFEEALVERRKAVELEPAGWSYEGLGLTLTSLGRFKEANEAYAKAVELAPENSSYWRSWACGLGQEKKYPEAIAKCKKALSVNPKDYKVLSTWGWYLEVQGKNKEAIEKYKEALIINPSYAYAKNHLKDLEKQIVTQPQPAK
jgi:tetratricopeptide (TPR) repeat protein